MQSRWRWLFGVLGCGLWAVGWGIPFSANGDELATYFERLRQRGLFQVAEQAALSRLDDPKLVPTRRTDLLIELSRTLTRHATVAGPANQAELWEQAQRVVDEGAAAQPPLARRELLLAQSVIVRAERAAFARWEVETTPWDTTALLEARQTCERALTAVRKLTASAAANPGRKPSGEFSPAELRATQQSLQFIEAQVLRDRARLGVSGSAERAADIVDAMQALRAAQSGLFDERRLWSLKLLLADLTRLQGDPVRSDEMLKTLWKSVETLAPEQRAALAAARMELALDRGEPLAAAEFFLEESRAVAQLAGEPALMHVRTLLNLQQTARAKRDTALAKELRAEAEAFVDRIAREVGNPWHRWARRLLEGDAQQTQFGPEILASVRQGEAHRQRGDFTQAAESYAAALRLAETQAAAATVLADLRYTRGSILLEAKDYPRAAAEFAIVGRLDPPSAQSASADLLAAFALGKLYEAERTTSRREAYVTALEQHLQRFVSSPTMGDAHWMLAQLEEQRLQASVALPHYEAVPSDHPRHGAALWGAVRCREAILVRLQTLKQPTDAYHRETSDWFATTVGRFPTDRPWSAEQGEVVLGAVRWQLRATPTNYRGAEAALQRFLTAALEESAAERLQQAAVPLQLTTWAGVGRSREALALIEQLPQEPPASLLAVVLGLDQLAQVPQGKLSIDFSALFLAAVNRLLPSREALTVADRRAFNSARLRCLLVADQDQAAATLAAEIEQTLGDDLAQWQRFGQQLEERPRSALAPVAQRVWRKVEARQTAGSPEWLVTRTAVIRQTLLLPDRTEAAKLLKLTRVLYGRVADDATRAEWDRLERMLARP